MASRARFEPRAVHDRARQRPRSKGSPTTRSDLERRIRELEARNDELTGALRARDEFIATLSHELRNPLSPIVLQTEFLTEQVQAAEQGVVASTWLLPKLETFSRRLQRLLDVLNRLMDVSKIGAGRVPLHIESVDLTETVRDVCGGYERELAAAGSALELRAPGAVSGQWDRVRLEQIFGNLLSNAIRYGAGRPVTVTIGGDDERATLSVEDHGIGIAEADRKRIFERFERGGQELRAGGFGLGLWVTRKLCEAMGGDISVQSKPDFGSTFTVSLPRDGAPSDEPQ